MEKFSRRISHLASRSQLLVLYPSNYRNIPVFAHRSNESTAPQNTVTKRSGGRPPLPVPLKGNTKKKWRKDKKHWSCRSRCDVRAAQVLRPRWGRRGPPSAEHGDTWDGRWRRGAARGMQCDVSSHTRTWRDMEGSPARGSGRVLKMALPGRQIAVASHAQTSPFLVAEQGWS